MLWTNNIAKRYRKWKFELYRFKVYLITLHTIRVRHSAAACTRLDKYMIFNCKSGSSPHCDCVQSITVEKVDAFLELKIFKNNCSTMLRMHFQPIKHYHMTIWTVIYWTSPYESRREKAYLTIPVNQPLQNILYCRANQEWQWRRALFTIIKSNTNLCTQLELMRIDRSPVYKSYPEDRLNTKGTHQF